MKTVKLKKPWHDLIMSMDVNDIANSYFASCNSTANYLNNHSEKAITGFAADFLESLDKDDLILESFGKDELLGNPDIILQHGASTIVSCFDYLKLADNLEKLLVHSNWHGKCGDKLVILRSGECLYVVNTTEKPENAFNDVLDSLPSYVVTDNLHFEVVAVIIGGQ